MLVPITVASLIGAGWLAQAKRSRALTPQEQANYRHIYCQAMTGKDIPPAKLRALAKEYSKIGMTDESKMLIKRAELAEAPPELKEARRVALRKLLSSTNVELIRRAADVHENMGAFGACHRLREYANGLEAMNKTPDGPVEVGQVDDNQ